ncbi:hypothetical protein [Burkholderia territorii]|uniref:hypothetical protein n=1 Tax=Burkholderia territorii TaxID=1503055 RepID=UPI0007583957|nr:hypothetical protein [Burkholderia territorii]KVQ55934.1 hypothetical protein WT23_30900 [Burkholderia territorii]
MMNQLRNAPCAAPIIFTVELADIVNSVRTNGATDNLSLRLVMAKKPPMAHVAEGVCAVCSVPIPARL